MQRGVKELDLCCVKPLPECQQHECCMNFNRPQHDHKQKGFDSKPKVDAPVWPELSQMWPFRLGPGHPPCCQTSTWPRSWTPNQTARRLRKNGVIRQQRFYTTLISSSCGMLTLVANIVGKIYKLLCSLI